MDRPTLIIEGKNSLSGTVKVSGSVDSAVKLICASLFCDENVVLDNVPRVSEVVSLTKKLEELGAKAEWSGKNRIVVNGSGMKEFVIPFISWADTKYSFLLIAPIIFRFGKAVLRKFENIEVAPPERIWRTWEQLGIQMYEDEEAYYFKSGGINGTTINFRVNSHIGTDNAILSTIFANGESTILNASEEPEVDDLIAFCNLIGSKVERTETRTIKVVGANSFVGTKFKVQGDRDEVVSFAVAAAVTKGNLTIKGASKDNMLSFFNVFSKVGCKYEFAGDELRVWVSGKGLDSADVTTSPAPGFLTDWQPPISLLLTQAEGESTVIETIYRDRFNFTKDLNRMGAKIRVYKPSELGKQIELIDPEYDIDTYGEPENIIKIQGPTSLKGTRLDISDLGSRATLVLAALAAEGKSEIIGYENVERFFEDFYSKLDDLGARMYVK